MKIPHLISAKQETVSPLGDCFGTRFPRPRKDICAVENRKTNNPADMNLRDYYF